MSPGRDGEQPERLRRIGVVVHPTRPVDEALGALVAWARRHDVEVVQVTIEGRDRDVAPHGDPAGCDLVMAIGGDGTTLAAIREAVAVHRPILGVACGSLGALTTIPADQVEQALSRFRAHDWAPFPMPGLDVALDDGETLFALNDIAVVRSGEGQVRTTASVDGTLFARFAGDGCIVSTPLGSSAYALAAGGPLLAPGAEAFLLTPLSAHGGSCPPLVVGARSQLELELVCGHGGARLELDGQVTHRWSSRLRIALRENVATIVHFADGVSFLEGLRQRRIIMDSPRIVAEDERG